MNIRLCFYPVRFFFFAIELWGVFAYSKMRFAIVFNKTSIQCFFFFYFRIVRCKHRHLEGTVGRETSYNMSCLEASFFLFSLKMMGLCVIWSLAFCVDVSKYNRTFFLRLPLTATRRYFLRDSVYRCIYNGFPPVRLEFFLLSFAWYQFFWSSS